MSGTVNAKGTVNTEPNSEIQSEIIMEVVKKNDNQQKRQKQKLFRRPAPCRR